MSDKILGISGIENFYPFIDMKSVEIREVQYPDVDMQNLPFNENTFDFVISDQVIEHLLNPKKAIHEFYRVEKKRKVAGGILNTCRMRTRMEKFSKFEGIKWLGY